MSSLTPAQLDRIEDMLEDLERSGLPEELREADDADSVAVVEHLDAYRHILTMARDAMPMEEPPAGVLDSVIAEAHQSVEAGSSVVAATPVAEPAQQPWWKRLRLAVWVPALGATAAAALLIVVMQPRGEDANEGAVAAKTAADDAAPAPARKADEDKEGRLADAAAQARAQSQEEDRRGAGLLERSKDEEGGLGLRSDAEPAAAEEAEEELADDDVETGRKTRIGSDPQSGGVEFPNEADDKPAETKIPAAPPTKSSGSSSSAGKKTKKKNMDAVGKNPFGGGGGSGSGAGGPGTALPGSTPPPTSQPAKPVAKPSPKSEPKKDAAPDADGGDDVATAMAKAVDRGESRRRSGQCGLARAEFDKARDAPDPRTRAKALAGLGLCELAAGNEGAANELFGAARAAWSGISGFIDRESDKISGPPPAEIQQVQEE